MRRALSIVLGIVLSVPAVMTAEDLTVVSTVTVNNKQSTSTQVVSAEKIRASDRQTDTIFEVESGDMVFIDHEKREYFETSQEEMEAQFAEIDKTLEGNPMMRRMLVGKDSNVAVEKGDQPRTILGYECEHVILTLGKGLNMELWVATELPTPATYYEARRMSYAAMGPVGTRFNLMLEEMQRLGGFPLASKVTVKMMGFKSKSESEATEVKIGPVSDDAFDIPNNYKRGKSPYQK